MPRPLHAIHIRSPTKIPTNFVTPVGADRCVGPLRTCRFRPRAHTQVRPYKAIMAAPAEHKRKPGHLYVPRRSFYAIPNSVTQALRGFAAQSGRGHCP